MYKDKQTKQKKVAGILMARVSLLFEKTAQPTGDSNDRRLLDFFFHVGYSRDERAASRIVYDGGDVQKHSEWIFSKQASNQSLSVTPLAK